MKHLSNWKGESSYKETSDHCFNLVGCIGSAFYIRWTLLAGSFGLEAGASEGWKGLVSIDYLLNGYQEYFNRKVKPELDRKQVDHDRMKAQEGKAF